MKAENLWENALDPMCQCDIDILAQKWWPETDEKIDSEK